MHSLTSTRNSTAAGCWLAVALTLGAWIGCSTGVTGAGTQGNVAIFKDDIPVSGAASSPDHLEAILQDAGFSVAALSSEQLARASDLNYDRFDVLVLPYGASFPVNAAANFRKFLQAGG